MPVHTERRNRLWRVVEPSGKVAKTKSGKARDGGGHFSKEKAASQARAMNAPKETNRKLSTRMKRGPVAAGIRG